MSTGLLETWRSQFKKHNRCPWPGPRPLTASSSYADAAQLRGRELEVADLAMACLSNHLLVIHGQSGVGKSSIINSGLILELTDQGKTVVLRRDWGDSVATEPSAYVAEAAVAAGHVIEDPFADGPQSVDRKYPNRLVYILDQFEELIRSDPPRAHSILAWIEEVAGRTTAKFVISLRSEYEHQLRDVRTRPFTKRARFEIKPIVDPKVIRMIVEGDPDDESDRMPITGQAGSRILELWQQAQSVDSMADGDSHQVTMWSKPGLLHLQATLYVLWMSRASKNGGQFGDGVITLEDVHSLEERNAEHLRNHTGRQVDSGDRTLFGFGLERSVEAAIEACLAASAEAAGSGRHENAIPRVTIDQTRWIFRDITEHLGTEGYKTPVEFWTLARRVIATLDEPILQRTPLWAHELYRDPDWLGRRTIDATSGPSADDAPALLASGPAAPLSADQLLLELYRCYFFALEWMSRANIVQILPSGDSGYRVTLTHDRYGEGLKAWRATQKPEFGEAVGRFLAHRGKSDLGWATLDPGLSEGRVVANVRWRQSTITDTAFTDVAFVNCDFAGSSFKDCIFEGTVFVNCVLDDVDFANCEIKGAPRWEFAPTDWAALHDDAQRPLVEDPPTFAIPIDSRLAEDLTDLRRNPPTQLSTTLLSPPSGRALAAVLSPEDVLRPDNRAPSLSDTPHPELPTVRGGLVMCGGRLRSLTFRRCAFASGARIVLRHVAGTSLEICDQDHGTFEIFAAAIRGLSVTLPLDDIASATSPGQVNSPGSTFLFDVRYAKVINTWLGVDLTGRANFDQCSIWQLINASEKLGVEITNSAYFGLINTGPVVDPESLPLGRQDFTEEGLSGLAEALVRQVSANVDPQEY